jgi:predicted dithiol-disulfide oxidoreductase (DUF899 family)
MKEAQMTGERLEHLRFPSESAEYRVARNALLEAEMELRRMVERVAAQRRALPPGGEVPDYAFERLDEHGRTATVRMPELFEPGRPSLMLYSFMYGPERDKPCDGCTHTIDGWDGSVYHADQRFPTYVVAKSPIARLEALARKRGWQNVKLLSTAGNNYSHHYFGDTSKFGPEMRAARGYEPGKNWDEPMYNVFHRDADGTVRHFWGNELVYAPEEPGQHHRAGDLVDPVWGLLDMSPEGRGDFFPKLSY